MPSGSGAGGEAGLVLAVQPWSSAAGGRDRGAVSDQPAVGVGQQHRAGVKVAVVDSGIDPDHPAVRGGAGGVAFDHGRRLTGKGLVFAAGVRWAIEHGMHVVNLSLSTGKREYFALFHELADLAYFRGAMLVGAVNNVPAPSYPSVRQRVLGGRQPAHRPVRHHLQPGPAGRVRRPGSDLGVAWLDGQDGHRHR
jgi:subtilisin family serine protease